MSSAAQAYRLQILDLWHTVEFFLPFDVQRNVVEEHDAHWAVRLLSESDLAEAPPARLWNVAGVPEGKELSGFELYIGLFDAALMQAVIAEALPPGGDEADPTEQEERNDMEGATCFAKIRTTASGVPVFDQVSVSTVPWALGQIQDGGLAALDMDAFKQAQSRLQEQLQNFRAQRIREAGGDSETPLSGHDVLQLLEVLCNWAGFWPDSTGQAVVALRARAARRKEPAPAGDAPPLPPVAGNDDGDDDDAADAPSIEIDILNSFYARDLQRVRASVARDGAGAALLAYLSPGDPARRVDLYAPDGQRRIVERMHPRHWPLGRWFADPRHHMSLMQQFAVNSLSDALRAPGLYAVNGPPGTGKTTMLRDVVADNLVARARVLAGCATVADAFLPGPPLQVMFGGVRQACTVARLRPDLTGFEMVVASSNNAAVENISRDLPRAAALGEAGGSPWRDADGSPAVGYLQPIALRIAAANAQGTFDTLAPDDTPWGLVAAALGRRGNRYEFADRLFFLPRPADGKPVKGFDARRHQTIWTWRKHHAGMGFAEAKQRFAAAEARAAERRAALAALADLHAELGGADAAAYCRAEQAVADGAAFVHSEAEAVCAACSRDAQEAAARADELREQERLLHATRPAWWKRWLGLAQARSHAAMVEDNLRRQHDAIAARRDAREREMAAQHELQQAGAALAQARQALAQRAARWDALHRQWEDMQAAFPDARAPLAAADIELPAWQVLGLWADEQFNRLRSKVFAAALQLHEAWLAEASRTPGCFGGNLVALQHLLKCKPVSNPGDALALWQSLFMVVPVVSSTFASIADQFQDLGSGALGWLFIDEAGQAVPQAAAGAIWRCQRTVVVGDPRQIEPVFTVPYRLVTALARQAGLPADAPVMPHRTSVQQLADADSRDGAWVGAHDGQRQWIGSPLRVHRRCVKEIFDLANSIAYEGRMVYGLRSEGPPPGTLDLGASAWVRVAGDTTVRQVVPAQLDCVMQALVRLTACSGALPPLYIITPFKAVKAALKAQVRDVALWRRLWTGGGQPPSRRALERWAGERIGTFHTFQGKEESIVWLVLGCSAANAGGASWVSGKPNLLNVGLTRARHRVFVIGDPAVWAGKRYFSTVAAALPVIGQAAFMERMALRG